MKQIALVSFIALILASCSVQKQSSNLTGRTDEIYFTVNDTRKKANELSEFEMQRNLQNNQTVQSQSNAGNYTNSYCNRLRNFGSSRRFNYSNYQPRLVPTISYNPYIGWTMGLGFVNPRFGYMSGYNSPFSPFYGYNMPFYNPFFSYGWGNTWMNGYYPNYTYNPFFYNPCSYYYGFGNGYYNPGYRNFYSNNSGNSNYARRTGSSNNQPTTNTSTSQPQNSSTSGGSTGSGGRWYSGGNSDRGGSGSGGYGGSGSSGGSSGGNSDRGSSGSSGSTRRR